MHSHTATADMAKTQSQHVLLFSTGQSKVEERNWGGWSRSTSRSLGKMMSVTRAVVRSQLSAGDTLGLKYPCWHCC